MHTLNQKKMENGSILSATEFTRKLIPFFALLFFLSMYIFSISSYPVK